MKHEKGSVIQKIMVTAREASRDQWSPFPCLQGILKIDENGSEKPLFLLLFLSFLRPEGPPKMASLSAATS